MRWHGAVKPLLAAACLCSLSLAVVADSADRLKLWYDEPATQWVEALPVGNGRLGGMVFGGIGQERIQLNEDTLWGGGPFDPAREGALAALPEIRRLIAAGEHAAAQALAQERFMANPMAGMPYQTVGDLLITMAESETTQNYRRELDLDTAVARTTFQIGSAQHTREVYVSPVDQVMVIELSGRNPTRPEWGGQLNASLAFQSPQLTTVRVAEAGRGLDRAGWRAESPSRAGWPTVRASPAHHWSAAAAPPDRRFRWPPGRGGADPAQDRQPPAERC